MFLTYVQDIIVHQNSYLELQTTHLILVSQLISRSISYPTLQYSLLQRNADIE